LLGADLVWGRRHGARVALERRTITCVCYSVWILLAPRVSEEGSSGVPSLSRSREPPPPPRHHQSTTVRRPRPAPLIDQDSGRRKRRARGGQRPKTKSERLAFRCRAGVRAISTGGSGVGRHQPTRQRLTGTNATGRAGRRSRRTESERARKAAGGRAAALVGDHQTAGPQSSVHAS
jgi:hypothetical protein